MNQQSTRDMTTGGAGSVTAQLATFVCGRPRIPRDVLDAGRVALQDTIGVALAGCVEEAALIALDFARESTCRPAAGVWGHSLRCAAADAALVNAISAHVLDFDDTLATLRGHPSAPVLPAVVATAEELGAPGIAVLEAYVMGMEIAGKLGRLCGNGPYMKGWHHTALIGVFAATAGIAHLRGLSAVELQRAWGLAAAQAGGLLRNFGTMSKSFQPAHAARAAMLSDGLARRGFTASETIFDGRDGFLALYGADGVGAEKVITLLGQDWELLAPGNSYKRWPCCYCSHRALGGVLELVSRHGLQTAEIEEVCVGFPPGADEPLVYDDPQTGLEAKFSIQYPVAALLLDGRLSPDSFTDAAVARPQVRAWMKKVRRYRVEDTGVYSGTVGYTDVTIATRGGRYSMRVDKGPGSAAWPMTSREHDVKFMDCAGRVLHPDAARALLDAIQGIGKLDDVRKLVRLMTGDAVSARKGK